MAIKNKQHGINYFGCDFMAIASIIATFYLKMFLFSDDFVFHSWNRKLII